MTLAPNTLIGQELERTEDLRFLTGTVRLLMITNRPAPCTPQSFVARSRMGGSLG